MGLFSNAIGGLASLFKTPAAGGMSPAANFFNNKLMMQLLATAGTDISNRTGGMNTANFMNNFFGTQNAMKMLGQLFGAPIGKITMDDKGTKIDVPALQTGGSTAERATAVSNVPQFQSPYPMTLGGGASQPSQLSVPSTQNFGGTNNPFASALSSISAQDLVGLTPETIMQALQLKVAKDEADARASYYRGQTETDLANAETARANAETSRINAYRQIAEELRSAPFEVPGIGKVDLKTFSALPNDVQAYSYYVFDQKVNKGPLLTFDAWKAQLDEPAIKEYYKLSQSDSGFKKFLMEYQKSGATSVNLGPYGNTLETGKAKMELDAQSPTLFADTWKSLDSSGRFDSIGFVKDPKEEETAKVRLVIDEMGRIIRNAYKGKNIVLKPYRSVTQPMGWYLEPEDKLIQRSPIE